ncbi:MAG: hypothetical protein IPK35_19345 [Saprospiraceae bacterium]|nr:hypothetical protein [Saprospiraceae bacterium]
MKSNIFIAGSGGIGQAVGLILLEFQVFEVSIYFGDVNQAAIDQAISFVKEGCTHDVNVYGVLMPIEDSHERLDNVLSQCDIILDCLPGSQAPRLASLAKNIIVTMPILQNMYRRPRM